MNFFRGALSAVQEELAAKQPVQQPQQHIRQRQPSYHGVQPPPLPTPPQLLQQNQHKQAPYAQAPSPPRCHATAMGAPPKVVIPDPSPKPQADNYAEEFQLRTATTLEASPSEFPKSAEERDAILHPASPESIQIAKIISALRSQYAMQAAIDKNKAHIMNLTAAPFVKKVQQQTAQLNGSLDTQIEKQKAELHQLQLKLAETLKAQLKQKIEEEMLHTIQGTVQQKINQAVEEELKRNAVGRLKAESQSRSQTYYQHEVEIHNLNARRHNSNLSVNSKQPLHMLWRPVHLDRDGQVTWPSPSELFPKTMGALYKLRVEDLEALLQEYGGEELISVANQSPEETLSTREKYLNKFMHLIGIPSNIVRVATSESKDKPTYYVFTDNSAPIPPILSFA